jgi:hypothetical protein
MKALLAFSFTCLAISLAHAESPPIPNPSQLAEIPAKSHAHISDVFAGCRALKA